MNGGPTGPRPCPRARRIVLTGFMGAGKSTVGRILAARLGWRFYDSDHLVAAGLGITVAEIFERHGEARFRELEAAAIMEALTRDRIVLALGGGAIETPSVREQIFAVDNGTLTVFLSAPLPELLLRCHHGEQAAPVRPLLTAAEPPEERLKRRLPHYQCAHLIVDTSGIPATTVVEQLLAAL